jgi:SAM-dependent methyltransferase
MAGTDPRALAAGPYRTPGPLSARTAIYAWQRPRIDLVDTVTAAVADLPDGAVLVDVGCGPGRYLRELRTRRPELRCVGVDVSVGMLRAVNDAQVGLVAGSADALPLRSATADAALALHMLYHLPSPPAALAELRRLLRPGGRLLVSTNEETADGLWQLFLDAGLDHPPISTRWPLTGAQDALRAAGFRGISEQAFDYVLDVPTPEPVLDYLDSCRSGLPHLTEPAWRDIRSNVVTTVTDHIRHHGSLRTTGRVGLLTAH